MKTITTLLFTLILSACAVLDYASENELQARLIVNQTVLRFIDAADDKQERADRVQRIAAEIAAGVDNGVVSTIAGLEASARAAIDWQSLSIPDQELLDIAISMAAKELMDRTGDGGVISETDAIRVKTLLTWISNAAGRYL